MKCARQSFEYAIFSTPRSSGRLLFRNAWLAYVALALELLDVLDVFHCLKSLRHGQGVGSTFYFVLICQSVCSQCQRLTNGMSGHTTKLLDHMWWTYWFGCGKILPSLADILYDHCKNSVGTVRRFDAVV